MTHGDPQRRGRHGDAGLKIGREGMKPVTQFIDTAVTEEKPFLLWYAPFLPHTPHNPPQRLLKKYQNEGIALLHEMILSKMSKAGKGCGLFTFQ